MIVTLAYFLIMAIIDGQKQTTYLIHIVPLYIMMLAGVTATMWRQSRCLELFWSSHLRPYSVAGGRNAIKIKQNTYGNFYGPMIAYCRKTWGE